MVRETRHLWVGNLPDNIREDRIREHFTRYGPVQSVKLLPGCTEDEKTGEITMACTVAFMDIKSASKAHNSDLKIDDRPLTTQYYEPAAIPSSASAATAPASASSNASSSSSVATSSSSTAAAAVASASPQNATASASASPYAASPAASRFPNGHGSSDEHGPASFSDRFYERSSSRSTSSVSTPASSSDDFRRTGSSSGGGGSAASSGGGGGGYHHRSGGRDRGGASYRNGPYASAAAVSERHSSRGGGATIGAGGASAGGGGTAGSTQGGSSSSWGYENNRYNSTGQTDTGYIKTPSSNSERRHSEQNSKKKTISRAGTRSPSLAGSTSSRSPSRSRSRSSSSSSSSSSPDTSSSGSPKCRRSATTNHSQPAVHSDDRRPLAVCVRNLPVRSSDTSLKDGLYHEYKKHGKVTWVKVVGQDAERYAIVCFKKPEDVEKALEVSYDKLFFGCKIEVAPYQGYEIDDSDLRPYEAEIDEFHPKATRTLFIGNLEKDVTASDLRKHFDQFGEIIEIDIKKQGAVSSYAFCQYSDIVSVVKAIRKMDGEHLGNNRIKLGFGKSMPYNWVWIDGVNEHVNEKYLRIQFEPFGVINKVYIDREKGQALVMYDQVFGAQQAVNNMRGFNLKNTKIQVDYASRECQESFFERLEKQGAVLDRSVFDDRRDSTPAARFSRYDTPTRPRTASYSSRSGVGTASQVTQSPGTPGSATPRSRSSRHFPAAPNEYYEQDYASDRHFRNYDEYSQGSAASHDDAYEPDYGFVVHDSPRDVEIDARSIHTSLDTVSVAYDLPEIRNLQKERVLLLEQLGECPSSGDELMTPKKRLKLDLLDPAITGDVIIEANRDHRKVMEVRRLSDTSSLKHHSSRRPSIDSSSSIKHSSLRHASSDTGYLPHAVCKRRKTGGSSDSGSIRHQHHLYEMQQHSGSESAGGSRPGTPLCDERPENLLQQPSEPRRVPRDREGPLTLPLPRFAAQVMNRGSVSVAGIKGQHHQPTQQHQHHHLSSPPHTAASSPRVSHRPPSPPPFAAPPPASPPPRPPSLSSCSSDGDGTPAPPSPSLEERIRSLDERYEKWSGSRAVSAAGGDALALLDANLEKFRQRHKLLDLDLKEVQPSEIVKSVMAKRSVFDEDLKRLENFSEKYEPKEFGSFSRTTALPTITIPTTGSTALVTPTPPSTPLPTTPLSAPPALKIVTTLPSGNLPQTPKTTTVLLSPRSSGHSIPAAKGLQYPFPTHPPLLMSPVSQSAVPSNTAPVSNSTTPTVPSTVATTPVTTTRGTSHSDSRLKLCASVPSDINRTSSKVNVNRNACKVSEKNIPGMNEQNKLIREVKSSDKTSEKVTCRRDSSSNSPRADVKTRRNSDTSARRIEDEETTYKERAQSEERKKERLEKIRVENEKLEREKQEKERIEKERVEKEKQEKERLEKETIENERLARESELEKQRLEKERLEKERIEKEQQEKEKSRLEKERLEREQHERLLKEKENQRREREKERLEQERLDKERREAERKEREEKERRLKEEKEQLEKKEKLEQERRELEERERKEREDREKKLREEKEHREKEEREKKLEEEKINRQHSDRERHEKERDRERKRDDERLRHKEDNHDRRKEEQKHKDHSENRHRENNKHMYDRNAKESTEKTVKDTHEINRRESHETKSSHDKSKHYTEKEVEKRRESIKENRENNIHDKHKYENNRGATESRHMSIDLDKSKTFDGTKDMSKRKERNNSLPASLGTKRRLSSHDSLDLDEAKKVKLSQEHRKLSERRDSKDSTRSEERSKSSKHKNNISKSHDKHISTKESEEKRKEKDRLRQERHKKHKLEKQKSKSKSREKESQETHSSATGFLTDKDFLARLELRSNEDMEKQRRESKERAKEASVEERDIKEKAPEDKSRRDSLMLEKHHLERNPKCQSDVEGMPKSSEEKKKRDKIRKMSSDSDSDEPKKHSIFDIVDDEPAYISMYDKVKARSCKNMAKQEEEKRQEKIKAKFSQLKQSRAKREEKKRSTSYDEDSDSEKDSSDIKQKRSSKFRKWKYSSSDSDSSRRFRRARDSSDCSEDNIKNNKLINRNNKSRITSDTSDDEYKKKSESQIKSEVFSDIETADAMMNSEEKPNFVKVKEEFEQVIKKERRNSKHQESLTDINTTLYNETMSTASDKFNSRQSFPENTSDEDNQEIAKKERSERREKKHKKKQKKQKHSVSSEESCRVENIGDSMQSDNTEKCNKHHEKKKEHSKKEKRRDKTKEGRDKPKKSKKNKADATKPDGKREGKMENIFGSLSEDSDICHKEPEKFEQKTDNYVEGELSQQPTCNAEPDKEHDSKSKHREEREREKEEHRKRKEKKRREKERRQQEAAAAVSNIEQVSNENSMDFADMGKQLEANMLRDESLEALESVDKESESVNFDLAKFNDIQETEHKKDKEDRKEGREKKKKRKKSKDEKSKHHHHHHHEKIKNKTVEKKEAPEIPEIKIEVEPPTHQQNASLPTLDETSPNKSLTPDYAAISKMARETPIISPIPKTPTTSKEKKQTKFIPGFGTEIDENIHETAVKSISEFEPVVKKEEIKEEESTSDEQKLGDEKPRVVISQEETEDAVAALLGESFGNGQYDEDIGSSSDQPSNLVEENIVQDDEEMRQAVQSLSANDLDVKPETPQSEHELQIDTDTEEPDEPTLRIDRQPKTPDSGDFLETEKPAEQSSYFHNNVAEKDEVIVTGTVVTVSAPSVILNSTASIGSPPSLTPIKANSTNIPEISKTVKVVEQKNVPLPEKKQVSVISQSWSAEKTQNILPEPPFIKIEPQKTSSILESHQSPTKTVCAPPLRQYTNSALLKISEPNNYPTLKQLPKQELLGKPNVENKVLAATVSQTCSKSPNAVQMHNLPARSPVQITKAPISLQDSVPGSAKITTVIHNRLPITPVMTSKPIQATPVILQQAKLPNSMEPPKLLSSMERPRMLFHTSFPQFANFTPNASRVVMQGNIRHIPPQGLLVPTRPLVPQLGNNVGNMPPHAFNIQPILKEVTPTSSAETAIIDTPKIVAPVVNLVPSCIQTNVSPNPPQAALQPLTIPKEIATSIPSPRMSNTPSPILLKPVSPSSKPPQINTYSTTPKSSPQLQSPKTSSETICSNVQLPSPKSTVFVPTASTSNTSQLSSPVTIKAEHVPENTTISPVPVTKSDNTVFAAGDSNSSKECPKYPETSSNSVITMIPTQEIKGEEIFAKTDNEDLEESSIKLAIEKVTEELNLSLEKESPEILDKPKMQDIFKTTDEPRPLIGKINLQELAAVEQEFKPKEEEKVCSKQPSQDEHKDENKDENKDNIKVQIKEELKEETKEEIVKEKDENNHECSVEIKEDLKELSTNNKPSLLNKEIDKFEEEKTETESVISDISKERLSADILSKDDPLDTKEDSDYWSAKEVNIDSVIKTLCSADEMSDHSSEIGKDDWFDDNKSTDVSKEDLESPEKKSAESTSEPSTDNIEAMESDTPAEEPLEHEEEMKDVMTTRAASRGRALKARGRGNKITRSATMDRSTIQTRRAKQKDLAAVQMPAKRNRGGKSKNERKSSKSESESCPTDIYEFRDESDENNKEHRPRLILTIKSPAVSNAQTIATVKEVTKDGAKEIGKEAVKETLPQPAASTTKPATKEEFTPPTPTNTRKSRRLQEKDISRTTVDDTIEDVVKNTMVQTRASANQRRSPRQAQSTKPTPTLPETPRKSPRGGRKTRRTSEAAENSSSEEAVKDDIKPLPSPSPPKPVEDDCKEIEKEVVKPAEPVKEKPHEGLKAVVLRRIKGQMSSSQHEPTNLIDPVTGELIPMRESGEGKYIPLPDTPNAEPKPSNAIENEIPTINQVVKPEEPPKTQPSVITHPQPITVVQQPRPQSLKAHVLSSQAAQATIVQQPPVVDTKPVTIQPPTNTPQVITTVKTMPSVAVSKPVTTTVVTKVPVSNIANKNVAQIVISPSTVKIISKNKNLIITSKPSTPIVSKTITPINQHLNINTSLGIGPVTPNHLSPRSTLPVNSKPITKQVINTPVLSPVVLTNQQKQQILQVNKQQQISKSHMSTPLVTNQVNTQLAHMKHQPLMKQQVIIGKAPIVKPPHSAHQQQILTGAVPSPPLLKSQVPLTSTSRIVQAPASIVTKGVMNPPKVDVSMANVMFGQRPKLSPQGAQQRLGIPVPGFEASLGEAVAHFPTGPLRPPDLNPAHYMHPNHVIYQQYLRQQQLHLTRIDKGADGQEGEEAPVTSPPLELRRPGSVGLGMGGRGVAVPHSLHSPHDRATDSPQVGQVYNVHSVRMQQQHYHPGQFYEQTEPPPAHRPLTSHASLAALGSSLPERPISGHSALAAHMGTPDRPIGGHIDRPLTAHMGSISTSERTPLGSHSDTSISSHIDRISRTLGHSDRPVGSHLDRSIPSSQVDRPISAHMGSMNAGLGAAGNLMGAVARHIGADAPATQRGLQAATPPHASQVPPQAESLLMLLKQYPCMWQGLLALKNDQAAVQMYFVSGNDDVAKCSLPKNIDGSTPPLRIFQRMRLEPPQVEGVARKMQMENEHCMLLALPCGHDHMDVLQQSKNLTNGFITYLQQKQAAGIINVAAPGTTSPPAYVVHIFPTCDFVNDNLRRIAPSLLERVADIAHLLIVITTV